VVISAVGAVSISASGKSVQPQVAQANTAALRSPGRASCPNDMVRVADFCVDRWEIATVDRGSGRTLSPYYPPVPELMRRVIDIWQVERLASGDASARAMALPALPSWQLSGDFEPMAVSRNGMVPQGYLSRDVARRACTNANKRLCRIDEWQRACRGEHQWRFPYGPSYRAGACNIGRLVHAAAVLHGNASMGHLDPRLNLVWERGIDPVLRLTGETPTCVTRWRYDGIYDMVGNLDEWVDGEGAGFVGGFYARSTTKGCEARVRVHPPSYFDYSTGARCCRDAAENPPATNPGPVSLAKTSADVAKR
jgi:sulfatase modifying factor 1